MSGGQFQSTLPARGATDKLGQPTRLDILFQSTLPARGATIEKTDDALALLISIHAPRTGSDVSSPTVAVTIRRFQSTLPARGATEHYFITQSDGTFQSTLPARGATVTKND